MKNTAVENAGKNREIDWRAFTIALIGGPFWGTLLACLIALAPIALFTLATGNQGIYVLIIPILGIAFGAPAYLTVGAIGFVLMARENPPSAWAYAMAGFLANLLTPLPFMLWSFVTSTQDAAELAKSAMLFGYVCAPIYGWGFGSLYLNLTKGPNT